jgi:hypothetical protein
MTPPDLQTIELNVGLLRRHAARVFLLWAGEWNAVVRPHIKREASEWLAATIQMLYWDVYKRNPTVHEWVYEFMMYADMSKTTDDIRDQMISNDGAHIEPTLNKSKPYWARYLAAQQDLMRAVQLYSEEVGRVFLGLRPLNLGSVDITTKFKDLDLTKAANIHKVIKSVGYRRPWWKRWLPTRKVKW